MPRTAEVCRFQDPRKPSQRARGGPTVRSVLAFIVRRLLWSVLLLLVVSFITFLMFVILPSADPALLRAGRNPSPEVVQAIRENLGLDKPWYAQYWFYIRDLIFHFDFGYSYQNNIAVRETIFDRLPAMISLAVGGAVVWLLIGIPYVWDDNVNLWSKDVQGVMNGYFAGPDLNYSFIK